jgi:hypothetical protein
MLERTLRASAAALRRRWPAALAVFVVLVGVGGWAALSRSPSYVATGVMSFQPREGEINGRDLTALLVARYPAVVRSSDSLGAAATAAGVSSATMDAGTSASVEPETLNLVMSVTLDSPQAALSGAQTLYLKTLSANDSDPYMQALQVQPPRTTGTVEGMSNSVVLAAVLVAALAASVAVALAVDAVLGLRRRAGHRTSPDAAAREADG